MDDADVGILNVIVREGPSGGGIKTGVVGMVGVSIA